MAPRRKTTTTANPPAQPKQHDKNPAARTVEPEEEGESQELGELLNLFQAQFKKRKIQKTKKAESEYEKRLERVFEQFLNEGVFFTLCSGKISVPLHSALFFSEAQVASRKRKFDETINLQHQALQPLLLQSEKSAQAWTATLDMLDSTTASLNKRARGVISGIETVRKAHAQAIPQLVKGIQTQLRDSQQKVLGYVEELYQDDTVIDGLKGIVGGS
ncbi:hypothetical protein BC832DRAFT_622086 [Gaertneriomyces semiglobifer]|nr:hypothetical protein BC832DRAFT_622086 [Gaertneriomyces semiglobifer]